MLLNAIDNPVLRLLRVEPKDEITSAFTREEVAAAHKWVRPLPTPAQCSDDYAEPWRPPGTGRR